MKKNPQYSNSVYPSTLNEYKASYVAISSYCPVQNDHTSILFLPVYGHLIT